MKIEKKYVIAFGLGVISIAAGAAYLQYKKLMNYCIGLNKIKVKTINADKADFDVFLNFKNQSNIKIEIESQEYNVYVNDKFITKASNSIKQTISPESTSVIGINVKFNPTQAGQNLLNVLLSLNKLVFKIDIKLRVKLWFFTVNVPFVYTTTIKELMAPSDAPKSTVKCK